MSTYSWGNELDELRQLEAELTEAPNVEGFLQVAERYAHLNLHKEAARFYRRAEDCEHGPPEGRAPAPAPPPTPVIGPVALLSGALSPQMVVEIIQMLYNTMRTGELVVSDTHGETVRLYLDKGRVINAIGNRFGRGDKSFERSLVMREGTYQFFERPVAHIAPVFDQNTDHLLLNALQRIDEQASLR